MPGAADATDPRTLVHRWFTELFNEGTLAVADEILADDISYRGPRSLSPTDVTSPHDVKEYVETYRQAFPDLTYTVEELFDAEDAIIARWSVAGTHENALFELESSGESFVEEGINIFVIEDGRISEVWSEWDTLKMVQELDVTPVGTTNR
ncbi:MAG: ester cyclase [Halobacteriales archaeon]|nr:ester cyclase [Halobacteriales archaeon]